MDSPVEKGTNRKQIKQFSGNIVHPNLDDASLYFLHSAQEEHKRRGCKASQSVCVRRAVRLYGNFLVHLTEEEYLNELIETTRASKGVI